MKLAYKPTFPGCTRGARRESRKRDVCCCMKTSEGAHLRKLPHSMCVHYDDDNQPCKAMPAQANASGGQGESTENYYGCLGVDSRERPGVDSFASSEFSDCFDCAAATMAIGRIIRASKGAISKETAVRAPSAYSGQCTCVYCMPHSSCSFGSCICA